MDFKKGIVGVGFAGKQRFELAPRDVGFEFLQRGLGVDNSPFVYFRLAKLDHRELIVEFALDAAKRVELVVERVALAHDPLRAQLIAPERGIFGFLVQLGEAALRGIDVKDASSAAALTA
jgi:hypothetical protein